MEYFVGSLMTLLAVYVANIFVRKHDKNIKIPIKANLSQSRQHTLISPVLAFEEILFDIASANRNDITTQATRYFDSIHKRIVLTDEYAYWIGNSGLVVADIIDGEIVSESQRGVDIMNADKVQLDYIENIVNALTEGNNNESSNPGN